MDIDDKITIKVKDLAILFNDLTTQRLGDRYYNYYDICTFSTVGSNSVTGIPLQHNRRTLPAHSHAPTGSARG